MATHSSILAWRISCQRILVSYSPWSCSRTRLSGFTFTHSSILAWRSPWTIQSMGLQSSTRLTFTFTFIHNLNQLEESVQSHWRQKAKNRNLQSLFIFPGIQTCYVLGAGLLGHPGPDRCYKERRLRSGCSLQGGGCAWIALGPVMTKALWGNIWLSHPLALSLQHSTYLLIISRWGECHEILKTELT